MHANCAQTAPRRKGSHRTQFPLILPGDLFSLHPTAACRSPPFHLWHIHQPWISVQYFDRTDENHNPGVQRHNFKKVKSNPVELKCPDPVAASRWRTVRCERYFWIPRQRCSAWAELKQEQNSPDLFGCLKGSPELSLSPAFFLNLILFACRPSLLLTEKQPMQPFTCEQ